MKQFSLEEYLKNPSKRVVTRDGRKVRIICTDFDNPDFPVVGEINDHKWPISFATNGTSINGRQLCSDLFFAPEKHEGWINLYYDRGNYYSGDLVFNTENDAKESLEGDYSIYVTTVKIEWEE